MVLMLSLGNGVETFIKSEIQSSLDPLTIEVTKKLDNTEQNRLGQNILTISNSFTDNDLNYLNSIKDVDSVTYLVSYIRQASVIYNKLPYTPTLFSTLDNSIKEDSLLYGKMPKDGILINKSLADEMNKDKPDELIGKEVLLQIPTKRIDGSMSYLNKSLVIEGIYESDNLGMGNSTRVDISYDLLSNIYKETV
jgi:hypothetical protein